MNNLQKFIRAWGYWIVLAVTLIISAYIIKESLFYRWFGYETIPAPITDEYDYAWQGMSLRMYGLPIGWTMFDGVYRDEKLEPRQIDLVNFAMNDGSPVDLKRFLSDRRPLFAIKDLDYQKGMETMVFAAPFFDHPPLGGLIYSTGIKPGVTKLDQVKPEQFRYPALVAAVLTTVLLFIFSTLVTNNPVIGLLTVIIYSTVPTYLLATRTSFLENIISPFILLHLICLYLFLKTTSKENKFIRITLLVLTGLFAGFAFLAKESAIGFLVGSFVLMILNKVHWKNILTFFVAAALPILIYVCWGLWLQKDLFINLLLTNSSRGYFGAIKPVTMLEALKFKNFPTDGWWIFGFISMLLISVSKSAKKYWFVTVPSLSNIICVLLLGGPNYPWYLIACIPLFAVCSAILIWRVFRYPNLTNSLAFFLIPFSSSYYWGRVALSVPADINHYRISFMAFALVLFFRLKFPKAKFMQIIWFIFLAFLIRKIIIFNQVFFPYMIAHWGNLPVPNLPVF